MKRLTALLIACILSFQVVYLDPYKLPYNDRQTVQTYTPLPADEAAVEQYRGVVNYADITTNYNFTDVAGKSRASALKMAALGISKGVGNKLFDPSAQLKNSDVLIMLVRLFYDWAELEKTALAGMRGASLDQINSALRDAYYQRAQTVGILDNGESISYTAVAQRQDIARWLFNAAQYQPLNETSGRFSDDFDSIGVENRAAVAALIKRNIMKNNDARQFLPKDAMNRAQFADLTSRLIAQSAEQLKMDVQRGVVIAKDVTESDDGAGALEIKIVKTDNSLMSILLDGAAGMAHGLVVLRANQLVDQNDLRIGDRVEVLTSGDAVRLVEVVDAAKVDQLTIEALSKRENVRQSQGVVISNLPEQAVLEGRHLNRRRVRVELDDDAMVELISSVDVDSGAIALYPIVDGKRALTAADLTIGSEITLYTEGKNILFVSLGKAPIARIVGSLREINTAAEDKTLTLLGLDGTVYSWSIDDDANVYINDYLAQLKDLKSGVTLSVQLIGDRVIGIAAQSYRAPSGYIEPKGRIARGVVAAISGNKLALQGAGIMELAARTAIVRGDLAIDVSQLKAGDHLTLYFDSLTAAAPSKIVVDQFDSYVAAVIRGKLINYNQYTDQIEVSNCQKLANAAWQPCANYSQSYKIGKDVALVVDGRNTNEKLNKDYVNRDVYMVIKEHFGRPEVSKLVFKEGYEKHYDEAVADYSTVVDRLRLKNNANLALDDGTIFLKENRIVDKTALRDDVMVYALVNQRGERDYARVISLVERTTDKTGRVFIGALQSVNPYDLTIVDYSVVSGDRLSDLQRGQKNLALSDDTKIYNLTTGLTMTREELFKGKYNQSENQTTRDIEYYRYYGTFVSDGEDHLISMAIRFKGLNKNDKLDIVNKTKGDVREQLRADYAAALFSRGKIAAIDAQSKRIGLVDAYSYSKFYREWRRSQKTVFLDLDEALLLAGDRPIGFDQLKVGDDLYFIRRDNAVYAAFLEN